MRIVVLMCDTFRYDHLGYVGMGKAATPEIDKLIKDSCFFERCFISSYPTIPNRRDLFTGKFSYPHVGWIPLEPGVVTLPEVLDGAGYLTQLIADTPHLMSKGYNYNQGFRGYHWNRGNECDIEFTRYNIPMEQMMPFEKTRMDEIIDGHPLVDMHFWINREQHWEEDFFVVQTARDSSKWIEENYLCEDFFLWVDCFECHEPWAPPQYLADKYFPGYAGDPMYYPNYGLSDIYTPDELRSMCANYAGEITLVDKWFGHVIRKLKDVGIYDDTCVIFMSDHGTYIGDHGRTGKSQLLRADEEGKTVREFSAQTREDPTPWVPWPQYDEVNHVPFTVKLPGQKQGFHVKDLVQPVDLFPTLLDLAEVKSDLPLEGLSLVPLLKQDNKKWPRKFAFSGQELDTAEPNKWTTVTSEKWSLCLSGPADKPELFDLENDPGQTTNVYDDHKDVAKAMSKAFVDFLKQVKTEPEKIAVIEGAVK